jgi:hypothetical protein
VDLPGSCSETAEEAYCVHWQTSPWSNSGRHSHSRLRLFSESESFPPCTISLSLPSTSPIFVRYFSLGNRLASRATSPAPNNSSRRDAAPAAIVMDGCVGWAEVAARQGASRCCQTGHRVPSRMKTRTWAAKQTRVATGAREDV